MTRFRPRLKSSCALPSYFSIRTAFVLVVISIVLRYLPTNATKRIPTATTTTGAHAANRLHAGAHQNDQMNDSVSSSISRRQLSDTAGVDSRQQDQHHRVDHAVPSPPAMRSKKRRGDEAPIHEERNNQKAVVSGKTQRRKGARRRVSGVGLGLGSSGLDATLGGDHGQQHAEGPPKAKKGRKTTKPARTDPREESAAAGVGAGPDDRGQEEEVPKIDAAVDLSTIFPSSILEGLRPELEFLTKDDELYAGERKIRYLTLPQYTVIKGGVSLNQSQDGDEIEGGDSGGSRNRNMHEFMGAVYDGAASIVRPSLHIQADGGNGGQGGSSTSTRERDICLMSQLSLNRLEFIPGLAASWPGTLSLALYVGTPADIPTLLQTLGTLKLQMSGPQYEGARVVVSLLFGLEFSVVMADELLLGKSSPSAEPLISPTPGTDEGEGNQQEQGKRGPHIDALPRTWKRTLLHFQRTFLQGDVLPNNASTVMYHPYDFLYPINALRNLALRQCTTEFVMSLDVDFLPSAGMYTYLTRPDVYRFLQQTAHVGWRNGPTTAFAHNVQDNLELDDEDMLPNTLLTSSVSALNKMTVTRKGATAFVLAAFEIVGNVDYDVPFDRTQLDEHCMNGTVVPFHSKFVLDRERMNRRSVEMWCRGEILNYHVKVTDIQVR
ncbi:hypothetical protein HK102_002720 [Quaeritorhiza haematococci]|nr:hypothetical protein HK102_002720 [Quaeritorhiza haematococci]